MSNRTKRIVILDEVEFRKTLSRLTSEIIEKVKNLDNLLLVGIPTRGIDIGAQALIWEKLRKTRDDGLGVLLISADLEELIGLSDRIVVVYQGQFVAELKPEEITPEILGSYMTGLMK